MQTRLSFARLAPLTAQHAVLALALILCACAAAPEHRFIAIIGAAYGDVNPSVVVVKDGVISSVGRQQDVSIPAGSEKVQAYGMTLEGAIEAGKQADLKLLRGSEVVREMRNGEWVVK